MSNASVYPRLASEPDNQGSVIIAGYPRPKVFVHPIIHLKADIFKPDIFKAYILASDLTVRKLFADRSDETALLERWFSHFTCLGYAIDRYPIIVIAICLFQTHIAAGTFSPLWFSFRLIFQCRFFQHRVSRCAFYCCRKKLNKSPPDFLTPDGAGRAHNFPMSDW